MEPAEKQHHHRFTNFLSSWYHDRETDEQEQKEEKHNSKPSYVFWSSDHSHDEQPTKSGKKEEEENDSDDDELVTKWTSAFSGFMRKSGENQTSSPKPEHQHSNTSSPKPEHQQAGWDSLQPDPQTKALIGWVNSVQVPPSHPTVDKTELFNSTYKRVKHFKSPLEIPQELFSYKYLLVPGLYTNNYPGYMRVLVRNFTKAGLDVVKAVNYDCAGTIETNATSLRDWILQVVKESYFYDIANPSPENPAAKKLFIIGHSKGGTDAMAAISMFPELRPFIHTLIALQTPFGGSTVAHDLFQSRNSLQSLFKCLDALGMDHRAMEELTYPKRQSLVAKFPYPIEEIPIVALGSSTTALSVMSPFNSYLRKTYNLQNDGLVSLPDAFYPGCWKVQLENMDHGGTVFGVRKMGLGSGYSPSDVLLTLIMIATNTWHL